MKRPSFSFDKQSVLDWLLRYGDKLVLVIVVAVSLPLAWDGFSRFRTGGTREAERPEAISVLVERARNHIGRERKPPASELPDRRMLAAAVDPWRKPVLDRETTGTGLRPKLFADFSRRTQPDVLPVEDLRATAGIHVVAMKPAAGKAPKSGEEPAKAIGKLTPYVVVTGLVPIAKQAAEFKRRFSQVGFQDPARDSPVWGPYLIERAEVGPDGTPGEWKKVLTCKAGTDLLQDRDWAGTATEEATADLMLGPSPVTPPYCGPLPQLFEGAWGRETMHPGVSGRVNPSPAGEGRGGQPDYKMLRFFDADVQPTASYTYRVTHVLANPNFNDPAKPEAAIPPQDLEDPESTKVAFLRSPTSNASRPVTIPVPTRLLVETLQRGPRPEIRGWKPGWLEIMILGPGGRGRARTLRSLVTEPGGMANVDEKSSDSKNPKAENRRSRGEDIVTNQLLVDARSQQEEKGGIQEPFDLLFFRPDGGFELVTPADSEAQIEHYRDTLSAGDDARPDPLKGGQPDQQTKNPKKDPPKDPFATPDKK